MIHEDLNLDGRAGVVPPQQARSLQTGRKVVAAARELIKDKRFEEIGMAEIADRAGVSVGAIYSRFASKEKLLLTLVDLFFRSDLDAAVEEVIHPRAGSSLGSLLQRYLEVVGNAFRSHRPLLRPLTLAARTSSDAELRSYVEKLNEGIHARLRRTILEQRDVITHPRPQQAVDLALLWAGAVMRERFLYGEPVSSLGGVDDATFVSELVVGIEAYLTQRRGTP